MKISIAAIGLLVITQSPAAELVVKCKLGTLPSQQIEVIRDSEVASTYIYYLQQAGVRKPFFGTLEQSRGATVRVDCVGKKIRALVVSGEFTANAIQGFVIAFPPGQKTAARLDFAEKSRPTRLYLAPREMLVVVPTHGYGETDAKYALYRHRMGNGIPPDEVMGANSLPPTLGFDVVRLGSHK